MRLESCHIVLAVCLLYLTGCSRGDNPHAVTRELVPVDLAMSMQTPPPLSDTKADVSYYRELANNACFRGMNEVRILSFGGQHAVTGSDPVLSRPRRLPDIAGRMDAAAYSGKVYHSGLVENNNAHLYSDAYALLPAGTGSVLVYGRAPIAGQNLTQRAKHFNGSLIESEWEDREDITAGKSRSPRSRSLAETTWIPPWEWPISLRVSWVPLPISSLTTSNGTKCGMTPRPPWSGTAV